MVRANMFGAETLGLFGRHIQDVFALRAERNFHGSRDALPARDLGFDFIAEGSRAAFIDKKFA